MVRRLPGGGLQVIIGEGNESAEGKTPEATADAAHRQLERARALAQADVGERIKRRHELAEKAWQAYQKMQSLGADKKGEAHELWEQIESLNGQLRQTFEPLGGGMMLAPALPSTAAGCKFPAVWRCPASPAWIRPSRSFARNWTSSVATWRNSRPGPRRPARRSTKRSNRAARTCRWGTGAGTVLVLPYF